MEFKGPYLMAMRDQDPGLFKELVKSGRMDAHLQQKGREADAMLRQLLEAGEKGPDGKPTMAARREAEEIVRGTLIEFPQPPDPENPEPPDDLPSSPMQMSVGRTSSSSPALSRKPAARG